MSRMSSFELSDHTLSAGGSSKLNESYLNLRLQHLNEQEPVFTVDQLFQQAGGFGRL